MTAKKLFAFGYGQTAATLAQRLRAKGWHLAGTCRTRENAQKLQAEGVEVQLFNEQAQIFNEQAQIFNEQERPAPDALIGTTHLLVSIPPISKEGPRDVVLATMVDAVEANSATIQWIGYLSTTGVYGDRGGDWVHEGDELRPTSERGQRRVTAENVWLDLGRRLGIPVHVFRLAGIYGPGRNQIASLRAGKARRIVKPGHVFSRIHVEDIATVLEASITRPRAGAVYNVCDDEAAPPQDVVGFAAGLAGLEMPSEVAFDQADLSAMARSFYEESKRVSNALMKQELGVVLQYPTYREGLTALYKSGE